MFFIDFNILSYPIRPQATTGIGYTKSYINPSPSNLLSSYIQIMIPYGSNTLPIKQKADSLRTASSSNLDNMVNNSPNFKTKYAEFSTKWQVLLHFHNPSCGYNQRCNLSQETLPLLQSILTSLFHPYLFTKSSLQFPLTLPSYITQQFFTSLFLCTTIPTIYTKNIFPISNILPIQTASRDQGVREYCED